MGVKSLLFSLFFAFGLVAVPATGNQVYAESVDPLKKICEETRNDANKSPVCNERKLGGKNPLFGPDGILTKVINILSIVVGIAAVIGIMEAGLKFIRSGDNPQEAGSARTRVLLSVFALIIAAAAQLMVRFILYKIT